MKHNLNGQSKEACIYILCSISFSVPHVITHMWITILNVSPRNSTIMRKTPCAADVVDQSSSNNFLIAFVLIK